MIDLISRQAAIDMFQRQAYDDWNQGAGTTWANAFSKAADMIEDLPTADAVEVAWCKDCKYRDADDFCTGRGYPNVLVPDDGFCDKGDLISRQAAIDACLKGKTDGLPATNVACDCCAERIRVLPSADVVEVVRCKDCKWHTGCHSSQNDYCSWGERKNDHNTGKI